MTSLSTGTAISTATPPLAAETELPNYPLARVARLAWAEPVAWAVLVAWAEPVAWVVLVARVVLAAWVVLVAWVTVRPAAIPGSTTHKTVVAPHIAIVLRRTGLEVRLAEIHSPTVKLAPGSRLTSRAEICPVTVAEVPESVIVPAV
jgi:hypothetical protein